MAYFWKIITIIFYFSLFREIMKYDIVRDEYDIFCLNWIAITVYSMFISLYF